MKKIINKPETVVAEMCNGIELAHPEIQFVSKYKILKKKNIDKNKVTLISGGGSGHEPAHAGYIGKGMLDAVVCGDVFASPSQIQVFQAIKETASAKGTLLIIKNYSGDMMNFKNAAYLAEEDKITVDYVKVDDDIAVKDSLYTVGRRGVAGTVLVHKIAGAKAQEGASLQEVKQAAQEAIDNVKSIGFALSSCTVPAKGTPTFDIGNDEIEYGVGIHGEPGTKREKSLSANELAKRMVEALLDELKINDEEITLMVNGFGGSPLMELYLLNNAVRAELNKKNVSVYRTFVGNYMTSIDMIGASLTMMKMTDNLKALLDKESQAPSFFVSGKAQLSEFKAYESEESKEVDESFSIDEKYAVINGEVTLDNIKYIVGVMANCIIKNEIPFCELDAHAGDGDFGMSVAKGFKQLKREWKEISLNSSTIGAFLDACSLVIMQYCGGASGPIWGSAFRGASKAVLDKQTLSVKDFAQMIKAAATGVQKTGERSFGRGAVVGDKTLIDALVPTADMWLKSANDGVDFLTAFKNAASAAEEGAKATEQIVARMGRAGTVGDRSLGYPDAGAHALGVIFREISNKLK